MCSLHVVTLVYAEEVPEDMSKQRGITISPKHSRMDAAVKSRFIDIIFWHSSKSRAKAANKFNDWQSDGKPWAELIRRFGYGSLMLVPHELTDER